MATTQHEFDDLAAFYDKTRGGEERGDDYAADVEAQLPRDGGPILEIGVGTGVVALGLRRRGRSVVGLDISAPMLARARGRLGPVVIRGDAGALPIAPGSVAHAVSVWVLHAVPDPARVLREVARALPPGGRYVVCTAQHPLPDDPAGQILETMRARLDALTGVTRGVEPATVVRWGEEAGLRATVHQLARSWRSSPADEIRSIELRIWPVMRTLDDRELEPITTVAIEALLRLPHTETTRRATADMIVLTKP